MFGGSLLLSQNRASDLQYLILENIVFLVFRLERACRRLSQVVLTEVAFFVYGSLYVLSKMIQIYYFTSFIFICTANGKCNTYLNDRYEN